MNTIETLFVPYELAVKLKELGFDEPCFGYYLCENSAFGVRLEITTNWIDLLPYDSSSCKAPLYQLAFRWFREKHQLYCGILTEYSYGGQLHAYHITGKRQGDVSIGGFNTYEEAELACLTKLIEIVKQNKN